MFWNIVFWASLALIFYTYAGYSILIIVLSFIIRTPLKRDHFLPFVSIVISAYNEEKHIQSKLNNCIELDYPRDKMEIIVASDGSTDSTDEIVKKYAKSHSGLQVILHRVEGRLGKTAVQNSAVKLCKGEIIIFSDAASMYDRNAIKAMVRNYADPTVGAVSGRYTYVKKEESSASSGTVLFWKFENFIKTRQSTIKTVTGCCGCIYSIRKKLYTELPPHIISDLVEPLTILKKGFRIVFEPEALAVEETAGTTRNEFNMRIRVIVRGMNGILYMRSLLNPVRYPYVAFQLLSHKILRWLVPVFCITAFISNIFLVDRLPVYLISLTGQVIFYLLAIVGIWYDSKLVPKKILYIPLYFCIVNMASLISIFYLILRKNVVTWQTSR